MVGLPVDTKKTPFVSEEARTSRRARLPSEPTVRTPGVGPGLSISHAERRRGRRGGRDDPQRAEPGQQADQGRFHRFAYLRTFPIASILFLLAF